MTLRTSIWTPALALALLGFFGSPASHAQVQSVPGVITKGDFKFTYDYRGVSGLANPHDPLGATIMATSEPQQAPAAAAGADAGAAGRGRGRGGRGAGGRGGRGGGAGAGLGLTITYAGDGGAQINLPVTRGTFEADPAAGTVKYVSDTTSAPLKVTQTYATDGAKLDWTIDMEATGNAPVTVGNFAINVPVVGPSGENPQQIFERGFTSHAFIEGNNSYVYYTRASGAPPFMLITTRPGTKLEYTSGGGRGASGFFVHSKFAADAVTTGTWRQENTALNMVRGKRVQYGFRFQWANSYDEIRDLLYKDGLIDIRVVPGMTVPSDLTARFSLRSKKQIDSITAEFPDKTKITELAAPTALDQEDTRVFEVAFSKLGENMLTIHTGSTKDSELGIVQEGSALAAEQAKKSETHLEFFATEPMETLIKKRASFLVNKQQIKDTSKWWDGVYGPYDMKAKVTRTIDDPDIFLGRMVYVITCDDIGLAKPPYIAEKNVFYPDQKEIDSLEYYLEHFVWGKLQRRDDELPHPYGVYGTPNWFIDRDPEKRKAYAQGNPTAIKDLAKDHIWRSYDYPHVIMLYYHMYQIAKLYPAMSHYLDAPGYLRRAFETAKAFYLYPYEIYPEYYESTKWGLYNELVVLNVIDALKQEGFPEQADWLTKKWEEKVKYFVYDDQYPFRSEYAFDRTAFESTYALAKYGATHDMKADVNLWWDVKLGKWYSHPSVKREDSRAFMDRQLASGLCVRGWLNPAYYTLGSDPGVSYMAAMGGWGILDYALNFAPKPSDWLQLGYASYLSSWCLMNTGTADNNYGAWFPGKENDGASGWQFESAKYGGAWMGSSSGIPNYSVPRGPWHYDGEIDLGYGGALRMAATVITKDPTFGWFAYGGAMTENGDTLSVNPRDGLRRRLDVVIPDMYLPFTEDVKRLKVELERDGFAAGDQITVDKALMKIGMNLENRTSDAHTTGIKLSIPLNTKFDLMADGKKVELKQTGDWDYPWRADIQVAAGSAPKLELIRTDRETPTAGRGRRGGAGAAATATGAAN